MTVRPPSACSSRIKGSRSSRSSRRATRSRSPRSWPCTTKTCRPPGLMGRASISTPGSTRNSIRSSIDVSTWIPLRTASWRYSKVADADCATWRITRWVAASLNSSGHGPLKADFNAMVDRASQRSTRCVQSSSDPAASLSARLKISNASSRARSRSSFARAFVTLRLGSTEAGDEPVERRTMRAILPFSPVDAVGGGTSTSRARAEAPESGAHRIDEAVPRRTQLCGTPQTNLQREGRSPWRAGRSRLGRDAPSALCALGASSALGVVGL